MPNIFQKLGFQKEEEKPQEKIEPKVFPLITKEEVLDILGLSIKSDEHNKLATFLCMLSAFTDSSQFNIAFSAPSSSGKSYIPLEIAKLFPSVQSFGYASPTSFFHDNTEKKDDEFIVDLERKILLFLDMPHYELLEKIRPVLSHDEKVITVRITDRSKRALRTKKILVKGYPAVIFCSTKLGMDEQEFTRFLVLSPESDQEKIRESIIQRIKKESDNKAYDEWLESDHRRKELKERILAIKETYIKDIKIESDLSKEIEDIFLKQKFLKPRNSRDVSRLISFTKSFALLNLWERKIDGEGIIIATKEDLNNALFIWEKIFKSQELNLPPYILELYEKVVLPLFENGVILVNRQEILKKHSEVYGRPLYDGQLRKEILPMLENAGFIVQEQDQQDKRNRLVKKL
ncbi:MAG: hypothetical protein EXS48_01660 [Candidatus Staskawiczbacteria bacterium]|nr:hypothetical protein [Candidatus Staskawiczbacteria bacterium]